MTEICTRCGHKVISKLVVWDTKKKQPFCSIPCFVAYPYEQMVIKPKILKQVKGGTKNG